MKGIFVKIGKGSLREGCVNGILGGRRIEDLHELQTVRNKVALSNCRGG